jgi:hypothetical protein
VPNAPFQIAIDATSDPGSPLEGVELRAGDRSLGKTDAKGHVVLAHDGNEGATLEVTVVCPAGYESPTEPVSITLRRFVGASSAPTYSVLCPPAVRSVVAVIRAENGPNLPVMRLGREIARTNVSGIAHVLLEVKPGESVELTLATATKQTERLRPQNPSLAFVAKGRDDYLLLDQKFVEERPKAGPSRIVRRPSRI